jgi:hypothetical protein
MWPNLVNYLRLTGLIIKILGQQKTKIFLNLFWGLHSERA